MADISQTAANVGLTDQTTQPIQKGEAGEAITQGQPVYLNTSDNKYYRCDSDASTSAVAAGIALTPAATGEQFVFALPGAEVDLGGTLTLGETYAVSTNVGAIAPVGDLTTGDYVTTLGTANSTSSMVVKINVSGVAKA